MPGVLGKDDKRQGKPHIRTGRAAEKTYIKLLTGKINMKNQKITTTYALALISVSVLLILFLVSCGPYRNGQAADLDTSADGQADMAEEDTVEIEMQNSKFSPGSIEIKAGTTVTWLNSDSFSHTVTSGTRGQPDGRFDSGSIPGGNTYSYTFDQPGEYEYFCEFHAGMSGKVTVAE